MRVHMTWYRLVLGDPLIAEAKLDRLRERATAELADGLVALRHESTGDLHCEIVAYFSPEAVKLARAAAAPPCAPPSRSGLSVLAGDPRLLEQLN